MKLKPILLSTVFVVCGAGAFANSAMARSVEIVVRPPEPRVVVVPERRAGYAYAPGYWRWNGHQHDWVEGRFIRERRGSHYVPARWEEHGGRWRFQEGHWAR